MFRLDPLSSFSNSYAASTEHVTQFTEYKNEPTHTLVLEPTSRLADMLAELCYLGIYYQ